MTAAGLALIAGGLATLISFRAVLFRAGVRRAGRRDRRSVGADSLVASTGPADDPREYSRSDVLAELGLAEIEPDLELGPRDEKYDDRPAGEFEEDFLPDPVLLDEREPVVVERDLGRTPLIDDRELERMPISMPLPRQAPDRSDRGYGDRVEGWVRPEYPDLSDHSPAGEYWTPVPDELFPHREPSASGYGWPTRVERLPAVPSYEPPTGYDLAPVEHEPTEVVTSSWQPGDRAARVRLPRSWASRNENRRFEDQDRPVERRRPRPRPRPYIRADDETQVYVSRHAADPPL
jgi:hypothetical protein